MIKYSVSVIRAENGGLGEHATAKYVLSDIYVQSRLNRHPKGHFAIVGSGGDFHSKTLEGIGNGNIVGLPIERWYLSEQHLHQLEFIRSGNTVKDPLKKMCPYYRL